MPGTGHPLWDPILSFSHTFSPKSTRIRGSCPLQQVHAPPTGNPGSATESEHVLWLDGFNDLVIQVNWTAADHT